MDIFNAFRIFIIIMALQLWYRVVAFGTWFMVLKLVLSKVLCNIHLCQLGQKKNKPKAHGNRDNNIYT